MQQTGSIKKKSYTDKLIFTMIEEGGLHFAKLGTLTTKESIRIQRLLLFTNSLIKSMKC